MLEQQFLVGYVKTNVYIVVELQNISLCNNG